jgi:hypothetical protein
VIQRGSGVMVQAAVTGQCLHSGEVIGGNGGHGTRIFSIVPGSWALEANVVGRGPDSV